MRRLVFLFSVLSLFVLSMEAADYRLYLEDFSIDAGESKDISLYLDNVGEITGIQADIVLPEGLAVAIDDEGYYCVTLNADRKTRNHTIDGNYQADGAFRIISYTSDSKAFKLNTGEIATITITASAEFKGTHTIEVRNIELAAPDGTQFFPEDESCIVTGPASEEPSDYRVYMEDFSIAAGETVTVGLMMDNPDEITGIQTDIYLPEGLSVAIDDEDYYCIELNADRKTRNHTIDGNYQEDGSFRIISYTSDSKPFNQNSGAVAFITLKADDNFEGTHLIQIMNTELANPSGTQFWPTDETSTVTCTAGVHTLRGDVNRDGSVNISDVTALIDYLLSGNANGISLVGADCNTDGSINISDVTALIDYLLSGSWPIKHETFTISGVTFKMVSVEGGTFTMGASDDDTDAFDWEKPAHQVTLSSFSIGQTEVTQALWQAVMGSNPSSFTGDLTRPVEKVSWNDCQTFITTLNELTGKQFRLPTEAEWEYAARGGNQSQGYKYAGSNAIGDVAWYAGNSSSTTHPVATKSPNELGLYDMSGNVFEWCQDWYGAYSSETQVDPTGPASGSNRVCRGGGWDYFAGNCRVSIRYFSSPSNTISNLGLRLALDLDNSSKFRVSETILTVTVGESKSVNILNGSGEYTVDGGADLVTSIVNGNSLAITGKTAGVTTVYVKDGVSNAQAFLNVIVTEAETPQIETFTVNGVSFTMVGVQGGTFTMGASDDDTEANDREKPAHQVTLSSFSIGQTEVTQALWQAVMGSNPSSFTGDLTRPVEKVSWNDCQTFITTLNELTGKQFRLPTEAEWEYAARGGNQSQGYKYAGNNTIDDVAWYVVNACGVGSSSPDYGTHPVATKAPNELGLYDMSGNVWEWCQDRYGDYSSAAQTNPTGPTTGSFRVRRGGSWFSGARECRVSHRFIIDPSNTDFNLGLRLAL